MLNITVIATTGSHYLPSCSVLFTIDLMSDQKPLDWFLTNGMAAIQMVYSVNGFRSLNTALVFVVFTSWKQRLFTNISSPL